MSLILRPFTADELPAAYDAIELAFGGDPHPDDRAIEVALVDPAQSLGAHDDGRVVVTACSYDHRMAVPGGVVPVAGVSWVSVAPTHRRRGLLTALMRRQLDDLHAAGAAVAALWASEGAIYQRFGYGQATRHYRLEVPSGAAFTRSVPVDVRLVEPTAAALAPVFDQVATQVPGWYARSQAWWDYRLHHPAHRREGTSPLRCAVVDGGYALYATKGSWGDAGPDGTVRLVELAAVTPDAAAQLWRYVLDLDLMKQVTAWAQPTDTAVLSLLAEPRSAQAKVSDGLWVRLVDVGAALAQRAYASEVDVVLEVTDEVCPWNAGRWHLTNAGCERTERAADLALDVRELGAAYLGSTTLHDRWKAGWVQELTPGALARTSTAFGWHQVAHCPLVF